MGHFIFYLLFSVAVAIVVSSSQTVRFTPAPAALTSVAASLRKWADAVIARQLVGTFQILDSNGGKPTRTLGVTNEYVAEVAKECCASTPFSVDDAFALLDSMYHEDRLLSIILLRYRWDFGDKDTRKDITHRYIAHIPTHITNWNLCDRGAAPLIGNYMVAEKSDLPMLYKLAASNNMWERRSAMMSQPRFIHAGDFETLERVVSQLIDDPVPGIQKGAAMMLRHAGVYNLDFLLAFLEKHSSRMSRKVLDSAMYKLPEATRNALLLKFGHAS